MDSNDLEYLTVIMSTEKGRKLIWQILTAADVDNRSMLNDPLFMARHEGQRSVGLAILRAIREIKANRKHADGFGLEAAMRREAAERAAEAEQDEDDF